MPCLQKKATVWALQQWLRDAQERTQAFYANGPQSPTTWLLVQGKQFPQNMIPGGEENGEPLYIARGFHDVSLRFPVWHPNSSLIDTR